jgi:hypothetical protein
MWCQRGGLAPNLGRIAVATGLQRFVALLNSWGAINAGLKLYRQSSKLAGTCQSSILTDTPVPIIKFLRPLQGTDSFLERNQNVAYLRWYVRLIAACA